MEKDALPAFPVDDATLMAVGHALGGSLDYPDGDFESGPVVVGADYSMSTLLDFLSGTTSDDDPRVRVIEEHWDGAPRVMEDDRPHYTRDDIIAALIAEVRKLRANAS